ncbi:calmodulin-regulated spectrin-associated protein 3 [Latimeria chalumnae]|uniref:calmodulin-regulated spectrin-associated protein 3 n=1 Tax=Latimeria chalumnae TaxID=7897 RepID=UPI00313E1143
MVDAKAMRKTFLVPEIKPLDQYDFSRAKICASVAWILAKSYGSENIPEELREPFYTDQYDQEHIKPPLIRLLLSTDIYCRVCSQVLPRDEKGKPRDNVAVLQVLARRGLQPTDQDKPVTEADLRQKPIKMGAHLGVIDALVMAHAMETMSSMKVPVSGEPVSSTGPIKHTPSTIEYSILFWINKVGLLSMVFLQSASLETLNYSNRNNSIDFDFFFFLNFIFPFLISTQVNQKIRESSEKEEQQRQQANAELQTQPSIRYRKDKVPPRQSPCFPLISGMKDLANGCAIAATIHYYCPDVLRLEDVCLKETMSVADSLYNLQLLQEFSTEYLGQCCHLALEDLLYSPPVLKINIMGFLAELFWQFEALKPEFVRPREPLSLEDGAATSDCSTPPSTNSTSGSPAFAFKSPFLPVVQQLSPGKGSSAPLQQSTSMSNVEGIGKTWTRRQLRPLSQAMSFSIPFGLDSDVDIVMGNPVNIMRSVSSDSLAPSIYQGSKCVTRATYSPPEDVSELLDKGSVNQNGLVTPPRTIKSSQLPNRGAGEEKESFGVPVRNGVVDDHNNYADLPTIEEALQIIHNTDRLEPRMHPEGAPDGFFLHSPDVAEKPGKAGLNQHTPFDTKPQDKPSEPLKGVGVYRFHNMPANGLHESTEVSRHSRDDDSLLRDNSLDSDAEDFSKPPHDKENTSKDDCTSCLSSLSSQAESIASNSSGVKLTSFAERKKKMSAPDTKSSTSSSQKTTPDSSELANPPMMTWAQKSEESPSKSPALNSEMSQLGARLEEKRRAIEAQKKRIEAIFAKHRQRLGKSAFLQLKKREGGGEPEGDPANSENKRLSLEERLSKIEDEDELQTPSPLDAKPHPKISENNNVENAEKTRSEKQVTFSPEISKTGPADASLGEYNRAVAKLNSALSSLQMDMERLAEQQQKLMQEKTKAWVIPPPKPASPRQSRDFLPSRSLDFSSPSPSPSPSRKPSNSVHKSPQPVQKRPSPAPQKSPKHSRPVELKIPPLTRVLTPPQNVDTLPHLRKFSPSQFPVQTASSIYFSDEVLESDIRSKQRPVGPVVHPAAQEDDSSETASTEGSIFSIEIEGNLRPVGPVVAEPTSADTVQSSDLLNRDANNGSQPGPNEKRTSLIEISLSSLKAPEEAESDDPERLSDSLSDPAETERSGVGFFFKSALGNNPYCFSVFVFFPVFSAVFPFFFFLEVSKPPFPVNVLLSQDEGKPEDEMAFKKAALLEKQQKRIEEAKKRKLWLDAEKEQKREETVVASLQVEEEPQKPEVKTREEEAVRRGDFTRQEHERRQQLKLMEDLDKVLRQKPTTVRAVKKGRPKTVFRDDSVISRSPVRGLLGSRLSKVYSHSTLSLSSMANDSGNTLSVKRSPRSPRARSPSGLMSPSRFQSSQNGEKDWENASTASSPASIPEYTGPKLYKEPSAKSNKHIIHNALSHCCLAGKVNESQKNKILEEMEKSKSNHFLILFRDSSCQFRAVYTFSWDSEEMTRLTGIGPRIITKSMIEGIYKYSSDRKLFTQIPSKTLSMSVDAVTIQGHLWQSKKPTTPKKPGPSKS